MQVEARQRSTYARAFEWPPEGALERSSPRMSLPASTRLSAKTSYKKLPGLLVLTESHLQWTQDGKKKPSVEVALAEAVCQYRPKRYSLMMLTRLVSKLSSVAKKEQHRSN